MQPKEVLRFCRISEFRMYAHSFGISAWNKDFHFWTRLPADAEREKENWGTLMRIRKRSDVQSMTPPNDGKLFLIVVAILFSVELGT